MALRSNMAGGGSIQGFLNTGESLRKISNRANNTSRRLTGQILTGQDYANESRRQNRAYDASANLNTYNAKAQQIKDDPWAVYRASAADELASASQDDPTEIYRNKLQAMATGGFGIDDPSYKFRFEQGQQALERSQASRGFLGSGNAAIELQQYGQESASQEYGAQFQRLMQGMGAMESQYNSSQSRLMQLAGIQTPGVQSGINAGITQSQISANASMSNNAANVNENARQFNVEDMRAQQYDAGVGAGLNWQDIVNGKL